MKRILLVSLLGLAVGAAPGRALAWGWCAPPLEVDAGIHAHFNVHALDWTTIGQAGPWYLYFPAEPHFQTAAPLGPYPNWPVPLAQPPNPAAFQAPGPVLPPAPQGPVVPAPLVPSDGRLEPIPPTSYHRPASTAVFQPVGYFYPQVPAYWYGR